MRIESDKHEGFKVIFVKLVEEYVADPSDKKQAKLKQLLSDILKKDAELIHWFNAMFIWRNTQFGLEVAFRIKPKSFPYDE